MIPKAPPIILMAFTVFLCPKDYKGQSPQRRRLAFIKMAKVGILSTLM